MIMKKAVCVLACIALLALFGACADGALLLCVNAAVDGRTDISFDTETSFTAEASVPAGYRVDHWEINGTYIENTDLSLTFTAKGNTVVEAVLVPDEDSAPDDESPAPSPTPVPAPPVRFVISCESAVLQRIENGTPVGDEADKLDFTGHRLASFRVTAVIPRGYKLIGWVIDGVAYTFSTTVKSITVADADRSMTFEPRFEKKDPVTLPSSESLPRTPGQKLLTCRNARMSLLRGTMTAQGGYFTQFDFTDDYANKATKKMEAGGRINAKVISDAPKSKKVLHWYFNDTLLSFGVNVNHFYVYGLDRSMCYEPIYEVAQLPAGTKVTDNSVYIVRCKNCTFTADGMAAPVYSGAVPSGIRITVTPDSEGEIGFWTINGKVRSAENSVTVTVNSDVIISCVMKP